MPQESITNAAEPTIRYHEYGQPGSGDGGIMWALFPPTLSDDEIAELWPSQWDGYYGGPGRPFAHKAHIRRTNTRALVTQSCGLDI